MASPHGKAPSLHSNTSSRSGVEGLNKFGMARHTIGIILLLCVVVLWQIQNFLGSSILASNVYAKPFFLTYFNSATFMTIALPTLIKETIKAYRSGTIRSSLRSTFSRKSARAFIKGRPVPEEKGDSERDAFLKPPMTTYGAVSTPTTNSPWPSSSPSLPDEERTSGESDYLPFIPTARLALKFCLLWFSYNYLTQACLQFTTVASATILGSTSSVWTLILGRLTLTEKFTWRKLCGVLTCLAGIILISTVDFGSGSTDEPNGGDHYRYIHHGNHTHLVPIPHNSTTNFLTSTLLPQPPNKPIGEILLGDSMAVLAAVVYAFYAIVLKQGTLEASTHSQALHMPSFFGLVGLFNTILLLPVFPLLHYTHAEPFSFPPTAQIWGIVMANSWSSLLGDVLCAFVVVFTSPLIVTVGLSLQIPFSLVGQMIIQSRYEHPIYWIGAMIVVASFVFVERQESAEEAEIREEFARRSLETSLILGFARGPVEPDEEEARTEQKSGIGILGARGKAKAYDQDNDHEAGEQQDSQWKRDHVVPGPSTPPR